MPEQQVPQTQVDERFIQLKELPKDVDAKSNAYVATYITKSHDSGESSKTVVLEYNKVPLNNYSAAQLLQASLTGDKGDNFQWGSLFWRFSIEGTPVIVEFTMNSPGRKEASSNFILPVNKKLLLPKSDEQESSVLDESFLRSFASYPFNEQGVLRDASELARSGDIAFVDSSDGSGQAKNLSGIRKHLTSNPDMQVSSMGDGAHFVKSDNYRYYNGHVLTGLDGVPDQKATQDIKAIVASGAKKPGAAPAGVVGTPGAQPSVFKPREQEKPAPSAGLPQGPADTAGIKPDTMKFATEEKDANGFLDAISTEKGTKDLVKRVKTVQEAMGDTKAKKLFGVKANSDSQARVVLGFTKLRQEKLK